MPDESLKSVKIISVQFPNNPVNRFDIPKLRGYIAKRFPKYDLIHNHLKDGKFLYNYPAIQFKTINRIPTIIGLGNGVEIVKEVFEDVNEFRIESKRYRIWEKSITLRKEDFGQTKTFFHYRFASPWMALKEENFESFKLMNHIECQQFLRHLLRENLKTISKGFDYQIPEIETVQVEGYFKPRNMNFKNVKMLCFTGDFTVNFAIPNYLGIGKQVARGYGMVERIVNRTEKR